MEQDTDMKTAVDRALEMMRIPVGELPPLALEFAKHLVKETGICMEVLVTAYAVYAQCAEGLPCEDPLYIARLPDVMWFKDRTNKTPLTAARP